MPRTRTRSTGKPLLVLVTAPDMKVARRLAAAALRKKLAACVNLLPRVESHYWWEGRLEKGAEVLAVFKTCSKHIDQLEAEIIRLHPYDTAEFVALPVKSASARYLGWWLGSLA